jgi:hypothetical protein
MKLDLEDFRREIIELDEQELDYSSDKEALKDYEKEFGKLPPKLTDWNYYNDYISKFQLPFDFYLQDGVDEVIDKHILFQFIASLIDILVRVEFTDKDEITIIYCSEDDFDETDLSELDEDEVKSLCRSFLTKHLKKAVEDATTIGTEKREKAKEAKEEHIKCFQEKVIPSLKLRIKTHEVMKIVRKAVEIEKNNLPF